MIAKTRLPARHSLLLVLALLLTLIPNSTAFAERSADEPSLEESSTEVASEPAAADDAAETTEPPADEDLGVVAETGAPQEDDAVTDETVAEPAPAPAAPASADASATGAGSSGPYDPNVDGSPSGNGNGGGDNSNKPCAGCVGNADGKNPPGQLPGPDDDGNKGYECDGNSGVGKTNPAHSGCKADEPDPDPEILLVKTGPAEAEIDETITYAFTVTNTGDTPLTNVHITDPLIGAGDIAVTPPSLAIGESGTATANYTVDAADVNTNDEVHNTATVHGTDPDGSVVTSQDSHVVKVPPTVIVVPRKHTICHATGKPDKYVEITPSVKALFRKGHIGTHHHGGRDIIPPFVFDANGDGVIGADESFSQRWDAEGQAIFNAGCKVATPPVPEIELIKDGPARADQGETIEYRFTVTNTGDTELRDVHVTDPLLGGEPIEVDPPTLAANGGQGFATAEYTIEGADLISKDPLPPGAEPGDRFLPNTATAHGTAPDDSEVMDSDDHEVIVPAPEAPRDPAIALVKDGPARAQLGETITYTFAVTNTGDTSLANVHVTDPLLGGTPIAVTPSTLAVGGRGTAAATYTVESADLRALPPGPGVLPGDRYVPNTATAHGTSPANETVRATDSHEVVVPAPEVLKPGIRLEKDGPVTADVGEAVVYTFRVTNIGEVTLTNVRVDDPLLSGRSLAVTPSTLLPGDVGTASGTYTVTKQDRVVGKIVNTATSRGKPPSGPEVTDKDGHTVTVPPGGPEPAILLDKSGPATAGVGDTITYRFRATNTGDQTLTDVHITDKRLGIDNLAVTPSTLLPGDSGTATATYTVTQADAAIGRIRNTAIVTGQPPTGDPVTDSDTHTTIVPGVPPPPPPPPPLPATGTDAPTQLLLAALALMMGAGLLLMARRTTPQFEAWTTGTMPARRLSGSDTPPAVHRRMGGGGPTPAF